MILTYSVTLLFEGLVCEEDINECNSNPCLNKAVCVDGVNSYQCLCIEGFTGKQILFVIRVTHFFCQNWLPCI